MLATFGDAVKPSFGVVPPPLLGARDKLLSPYDPAASKALLAEAGVSGLKLKVEFGTSMPDLLVAAQVSQAQLAAVGITLSMSGRWMARRSPRSSRTPKAAAGEDVELFFFTFTTAPDPELGSPSGSTAPRSGCGTSSAPADAGWGADNSAAAAEPNAAKRAAMYVALQTRLGGDRRLRLPLPRRQCVGVAQDAEGGVDAGQANGRCCATCPWPDRGIRQKGPVGSHPGRPALSSPARGEPLRVCSACTFPVQARLRDTWRQRAGRALPSSRLYRRCFYARMPLVVGWWIHSIALGWLMWRLSASPWLLGLLALCDLGPTFLLGPITGTRQRPAGPPPCC